MPATTSPQGQQQRVHELMTRDAERTRTDHSIAKAAELLAEAGVGALPVCDSEDRVVGMITDRDIVLRVVAQGIDPRHVSVGDCAERHPITLDEDATLGHARALMREHGVRRLPVVRDRRLVGIVGHSDLHEYGAPGQSLALQLEPADARSASWMFTNGYGDNDGGAARDHQRGAPSAVRDRADERERRADEATIAYHVQDMLAGRN
jgi:CBS domain-containing protein